MKSLPYPLVLLCLLLVSCFGCATRAEAVSLKAQITSPVNGSALTSTTLNLTWTPGLNVRGYALWVGQTVDGYDLHASYLDENATGKTVTIPASGGKIHVQLFSLIGDTYVSNAYVYDAPKLEKAAITSPANGATLTGTTLDCSWTAGVGVSEYAIWVGTTYAGTDIKALSMGTSTSCSIPVPSNGGPLYITLWSYTYYNVWEAVHYWVNSAAPAGARPARLTSPAIGTTLTSTTLNLTWDAGVLVTGYALWVGTDVNKYDIYAGYEGTNLSKTLTVSPTGGRIFIRLHSLINGVYQTTDYWVTAHSIPPPKPAKVLSPLAGAQLTTNSLPLQWGPGIGAASYAYWLGTSPGTYDLGAVNTGTATTATIGGLPTNGRPVYLTLYTNFLNNAPQLATTSWYQTQDTPGGSKPSLIVSPANGSTLDGQSNTFVFNADPSVTERAIWIGTTVGGYQLLAAGLGTGTSLAGFKPPPGGGLIYVRLHSKINNVFQYVDYVFNGPADGKAEVTSPATGALLGDNPVSLDWSSGTGVTGYALWVGSKPGGYDLYAGTEGMARSKVLPPLPQDGRPIYVRLHSLIGSAYQTSDSHYQSKAHPSGISPLQIYNGTTLDAGEEGQIYQTTLQTTGGYGVKTWSLVSGALPPGIQLSATNGILAGLPVVAGTYAFTLRVADQAWYETTKAFTLTVNSAVAILDADGDGFSDATETQYGFDPNDASSNPDENGDTIWMEARHARAYHETGRSPAGFQNNVQLWNLLDSWELPGNANNNNLYNRTSKPNMPDLRETPEVRQIVANASWEPFPYNNPMAARSAETLSWTLRDSQPPSHELEAWDGEWSEIRLVTNYKRTTAVTRDIYLLKRTTDSGSASPWTPDGPSVPWTIDGVVKMTLLLEKDKTVGKTLPVALDIPGTNKYSEVGQRPMELILDNNNIAYKPDSEALGVSNYVTTDGLPQDSQFGGVVEDPKNFRLQARLPNSTTTSVQMKLEVKRDGAVVTTHNYTLDKKDGDFVRGRFLRLVADTNDDAASGAGATSDPNNQTILVKLGDKIKVSYDIAAGSKVEQEIQVGRPASEDNNEAEKPWKHDIREVKVRLVGFGGAVTAAQLDQEIETLNERFAQCGIKMKVVGKDANVALPAEWANGGYTEGAAPVRLMNPDESDALAQLDGDSNTVDCFYVPDLNDGIGNQIRAFQYRAGRNATGNAAFKNFIVLGPIRTELTIAHEMMHILLNIPHRTDASGNYLDTDTALFHGTTTKSVDGTKRVGPYPASATGVGNDDTTRMRGNSETLP